MTSFNIASSIIEADKNRFNRLCFRDLHDYDSDRLREIDEKWHSLSKNNKACARVDERLGWVISELAWVMLFGT